MDIAMVTVTGGLPRAAGEYQGLLARGVFRMERVLQTPSGISNVDARPAGRARARHTCACNGPYRGAP